MLTVSFIECSDSCRNRRVLRHEGDAISCMHIQALGLVTFDGNERMRGIAGLLQTPPLAGDDLVAWWWSVRRWWPGKLRREDTTARHMLQVKLLERCVVDRGDTCRDDRRNLRRSLHGRLCGKQRTQAGNLARRDIDEEQVRQFGRSRRLHLTHDRALHHRDCGDLHDAEPKR